MYNTYLMYMHACVITHGGLSVDAAYLSPSPCFISFYVIFTKLLGKYSHRSFFFFLGIDGNVDGTIYITTGMYDTRCPSPPKMLATNIFFVYLFFSMSHV